MTRYQSWVWDRLEKTPRGARVVLTAFDIDELSDLGPGVRRHFVRVGEKVEAPRWLLLLAVLHRSPAKLNRAVPWP